MRQASLAAALGAALFGSACSDSGETAQSSSPAPVPIAGPAVPQAKSTNDDKITAPAAKAGVPLPQGSGFDFYVLALSWSPAYCAREGRDADPRQCNASKPYGFIVHGLWPQHERGSPDFCDAGNPSRGDIDSVLDLTPSPGLLRHEWEKHGSCSGLTVRDYYAVMRAARQKVKIPAQFNTPMQAFRLSAQALEQAFVRANAGLTAQSIAVACPQNDFAEVRVCMDKALNFRTCPEVDRAGCRSQSVSIEPIN